MTDKNSFIGFINRYLDKNIRQNFLYKFIQSKYTFKMVGSKKKIIKNNYLKW